jgi:hypothetical protein
MLWQALVRRNYLYLGVKQALGTHALTVYSGAQPEPADVIVNWDTTYRSANTNFLGHYQGAIWTAADGTDICNLSTIPAAVNASNSGNAAWAILWAGINPALAAMNAAIPGIAFIVVPCSVTGGTGVLQFASIAFTAAASKAIASGQILAGGL